MAGPPNIAPNDHVGYLRLALELAQNSPLKSTNFRVGAVLVDEANNKILATGYTLELPGNTHAEQCCLQKFFESQPLGQASANLPESAVLYTTMEPCSKRLSGNLPCVDRILETRKAHSGGIQKVYAGVQEPETFVGENEGKSKLEAAGIGFIHIKGLEDSILTVATAGHV